MPDDYDRLYHAMLFNAISQLSKGRFFEYPTRLVGVRDDIAYE
jgi:hypothetical protein